ncbi:MAG: thiosulfate oxidation carrier protein SoxY [Gammaproteobacteria bacterium]|nr:thiosulfate oxidation carrier protein SoxY [Gammaproteobacteria bacterium]
MSTDTKRRLFLKGTMAGGVVALVAGAGLLSPRQVLAAWPKAAFEAKGLYEAMKGISGTDTATGSADIIIKAPDIAENGAVVPIKIDARKISGVTSIAILAEKNPTPLIANFKLGKSTQAFVSTRIKMGKTSNVIAVVSAGSKVTSARKEVKVTIGGCGG